MVKGNMIIPENYSSPLDIRETDKDSLLRQLEIKGEQDKAGLYFHHRLLEEELPLTMGGGSDSHACACSISGKLI